MARERKSIFTDGVNMVPWKCWSALTRQFDSLPKTTSERVEGDLFEQGWVFRGHKKESYPLQPSIERVHTEWAEAEHRMLQEFQSKAPLHMDSGRLPRAASKHKLSWLAVMQHYGVPTRLLDFTYSPYVALYFALRNRKGKEAESDAEVWGIDAAAVKKHAMRASREADDKVREYAGQPKRKLRRVSLRYLESPIQAAQQEQAHLEGLVRDALRPCVARQEHYDANGFVAVALPTAENARLASQQGVFLFNGAVGKSFEESLQLMMKDASVCWYKRFRVPAAELKEVEKRLFQFNIHELSLFPDTEGLAGFVKQKLRLQFQ
jgi:hypothetical protein